MRISKTIYNWIWIRAESERLRALSPKWNIFIIPFPSELRDKVGRIPMILRKQCLPDTVGLTHMWIQRTCAIICKTCTCSSQMGSLCWERKQAWTSIPIKSVFADDDHSHGGGSVFSYRASLGVLATLWSRPHDQKWSVSTGWNSMILLWTFSFVLDFIFCFIDLLVFCFDFFIIVSLWVLGLCFFLYISGP